VALALWIVSNLNVSGVAIGIAVGRLRLHPRELVAEPGTAGKRTAPAMQRAGLAAESGNYAPARLCIANTILLRNLFVADINSENFRIGAGR
jgi:hypothetical protein